MPTKVSPDHPGRIYVLSDPKTGDIRYLGITILSVLRRFSMHKSSVTGGKHSEVYRWIKDLRDEGLEPIPSLVEDDVIDPLREVYWIALLHDVGVDLLNMDNGGTGKGKKLTADHARKIGESHVGIKRTLESRLKQVRSRNRGRAKGSAMHIVNDTEPESNDWEDATAGSITDLARVETPVTGSVLGKNFSRIRELAQRIAQHDEERALQVIEGTVIDAP